MPRDGSGNYTLPAGNPVVTGTLVTSAWANTTMSDIAVQMNNVLTRDGVLGPVGPFKLVDGAVATPGLAFNAEPGLGLYRPGTGILNFASTNAIPMSLDSSSGTLTALRVFPRLTSGSPASSLTLSNQPSGTANRTDFSVNVGAAAVALSSTGVGTGVSLPVTLTTSGLTAGLSLIDTGASGSNLKFTGDGATTPSKTIRVKAGVMEWLNNAYGAVIANLTDGGTFTAVNVGIFSDERLKKNIAPSLNALDRLRKLRPVRYQLRADEDPDKWYLGLIAQDVENVYPELVNEDGDGMKSVNYIGLISELIQAVYEIEVRFRVDQ